MAGFPAEVLAQRQQKCYLRLLCNVSIANLEQVVVWIHICLTFFLFKTLSMAKQQRAMEVMFLTMNYSECNLKIAPVYKLV